MTDDVHHVNCKNVVDSRTGRGHASDMSEQILARVEWQSETTGAKGHGEWIPSEQAHACAKDGNRKHPTLRHWVEYKPDDPATAIAAETCAERGGKEVCPVCGGDDAECADCQGSGDCAACRDEGSIGERAES
jgi:hypothetical protein